MWIQPTIQYKDTQDTHDSIMWSSVISDHCLTNSANCPAYSTLSTGGGFVWADNAMSLIKRHAACGDSGEEAIEAGGFLVDVAPRPARWGASFPT